MKCGIEKRKNQQIERGKKGSQKDDTKAVRERKKRGDILERNGGGERMVEVKATEKMAAAEEEA